MDLVSRYKRIKRNSRGPTQLVPFTETFVSESNLKRFGNKQGVCKRHNLKSDFSLSIQLLKKLTNLIILNKY